MARSSSTRHQGLAVVLVIVALVVGLDASGIFGSPHAPLETEAPTTVQGVHGSRIEVVVYLPPEDDPITQIVRSFVSPGDDNAETLETTLGFEKAFETDRRDNWNLEVIPFTGTGNLLDSVAARADAVTIAEEIRPFFVLGGPLLGTAFADELASRGVMCMMCVTSGSNEFYAQHAPYLWSLQTTPEQVGAHAAEYVARRLQGRTAEHAGDPAIQRRERAFGLLSMNGQFGGAGLAGSIKSHLRDRGVPLTDAVEYSDSAGVKQVQATMIGRLKHRGVTSVIYAGDPLSMRSFMKEATDQRWFPEWIMIGAFSSERSSWGRDNDPQQMAHAFGITPLPMPGKPGTDPITQIYRRANGEDPPAKRSATFVFAPMFLFFQGLDRIGDDDLTPSRMADAFFAGPGIGGDDPAIPQIGFGDEGPWPYPDYAGIDDFTEIWWDPVATGVDEYGIEGAGMWSFVHDGRRYEPGEWPDSPPEVFDRSTSATVRAG